MHSCPVTDCCIHSQLYWLCAVCGRPPCVNFNTELIVWAHTEFSQSQYPPFYSCGNWGSQHLGDLLRSSFPSTWLNQELKPNDSTQERAPVCCKLYSLFVDNQVQTLTPGGCLSVGLWVSWKFEKVWDDLKYICSAIVIANLKLWGNARTLDSDLWKNIC